MTYRYIIIEDNQGAMGNLLAAMKPFADFQLAGCAATAAEGFRLALSERPMVVFMDVELGGDNGFELMRQIREAAAEQPLFIMMTDFDKYAKDAANNDVLYFLDKPIDPDELLRALNKARKQHRRPQTRLIIKNTEGHFFIDFHTILYIEALGNTSKLFRNGLPMMCVTKTLKEFEELLPENFVRVHRAFIVNKDHIRMMNTAKRILQIERSGDGKKSDYAQVPIGNLFLEKVRSIILNSA